MNESPNPGSRAIKNTITNPNFLVVANIEKTCLNAIATNKITQRRINTVLNTQPTNPNETSRFNIWLKNMGMSTAVVNAINMYNIGLIFMVKKKVCKTQTLLNKDK